MPCTWPVVRADRRRRMMLRAGLCRFAGGGLPVTVISGRVASVMSLRGDAIEQVLDRGCRALHDSSPRSSRARVRECADRHCPAPFPEARPRQGVSGDRMQGGGAGSRARAGCDGSLHENVRGRPIRAGVGRGARGRCHRWPREHGRHRLCIRCEMQGPQCGFRSYRCRHDGRRQANVRSQLRAGSAHHRDTRALILTPWERAMPATDVSVGGMAPSHISRRPWERAMPATGPSVGGMAPTRAKASQQPRLMWRPGDTSTAHRPTARRPSPAPRSPSGTTAIRSRSPRKAAPAAPEPAARSARPAA